MEPKMKFLNSDSRISGFAVPLLSLKTRQGACGEYPDIAVLAALAKSWNMSLVQLLPVNDSGMQTSPYSALSAFALNPIYLRIGDLPEASGPEAWAKEARESARALIEGHLSFKKVAYEDIARAKRDILFRLWKGMAAWSGRAALIESIENWIRQNRWARVYACFITLREGYAEKPWWEWPRHGDPEPGLIDSMWKDEEYADSLRFHAWVQMACSQQFERAFTRARGLGIDIMGDIPILMNADSADIWFDRAIFDMEKAAGAPPDMYSAAGQNWGFPLYRWDELDRRGYSFWKERLAVADRYYSAYRIDHVLGFFRIWAIPKFEEDGFLGHFVPELPLSRTELAALGFDSPRIRWLSQPHVPAQAVANALSVLDEAARSAIASRCFTRIGTEELFLFNPEIRGMADIRMVLREAMAPDDSSLQNTIICLSVWWRNRALLEIEPGKYIGTWDYSNTTSWKSLSESEKSLLGSLLEQRRSESMKLWENSGRKILSAISEGIEMRACAEDLGAVPPCVPAVLGELGIPGLRVLRWHREWGKSGSPYVPFDAYPEESVACTSVHDSTNLRQWWREEAERESLWAMISEALGLAIGPTPFDLDPDSALLLLKAFTKVQSRILIIPLQDLLAASSVYREDRPEDERINVPGTSGGSNWLYRLNPYLETLVTDEALAARLGSVRR